MDIKVSKVKRVVYGLTKKQRIKDYVEFDRIHFREVFNLWDDHYHVLGVVI